MRKKSSEKQLCYFETLRPYALKATLDFDISCQPVIEEEDKKINVFVYCNCLHNEIHSGPNTIDL